MEDWQEGVVEEKTELDKKIEKMKTFVHSASFLSVVGEDRVRLLWQYNLMMRYSEVLEERINAFEINNKVDDDV